MNPLPCKKKQLCFCLALVLYMLASPWTGYFNFNFSTVS